MSQRIFLCRSTIWSQVNDRRHCYQLFCSYRMEYMAELASVCGRQLSTLCCSASLALLLSLLHGVSSTQYTAQGSLLEIWIWIKQCECTASTWQNKYFFFSQTLMHSSEPLFVWVVCSLAHPRKLLISGVYFVSVAYHIMLHFSCIYWPLNVGPIGCSKTSVGN